MSDQRFHILVELQSTKKVPWLFRGRKDGLFYVTVGHYGYGYDERYYDDVSYASVDRIIALAKRGEK